LKVILAYLFLLFFSLVAVAEILPKNAHKNTYSNGWSCDKGFKKSGNSCVAVKIPKNAKLTYLGNNWECKKGFKKTRNSCVAVKIPKNAKLTYLGNNWECKKGFKKTRNSCVLVKVPKNAKLTYLGNSWECNKKFKKKGDFCVGMTPQEIQKQQQVEKAFIAEIQRRKTQGVSGDDCETEYKTNAEVCVEITGGDLDCSESYSGNYYTDCDATLSYEVQTDYSGGAYLDVDVECKVEIEYKGGQIYSTQFDSITQDESHSLYAHGSDSKSINFNFSFSTYQEITSAKISSVECEIDSVDMY